jgi:hypothetical protein
MRIFENIKRVRSDLHAATGLLGLDLVHQLHRLDDAEHLALLHHRAHVDEGRALRRGGAVERADEGRVDGERLLVTLGAGGSAGRACRARQRRVRRGSERRNKAARRRLQRRGRRRRMPEPQRQALGPIHPVQPGHVRVLQRGENGFELVDVHGSPGSSVNERQER